MPVEIKLHAVKMTMTFYVRANGDEKRNERKRQTEECLKPHG